MTNATAESFRFALSQTTGSQDSPVNDVASSRAKGKFTDQVKADAEGPAKPAEAQRDAHLLRCMTELMEVSSAVLLPCFRSAPFATVRTFFVDGGLPNEFNRSPSTARMAAMSG